MLTFAILLIIVLPMAGAFTSPVNLHSPRISRPVERSIDHFSSRPDGKLSQMFLGLPVPNDLEAFFSKEKLKPPPQRFYKDLDNPIDKLEEFLGQHESRVAYSTASDQVKACLLYVAAHFYEDDDDFDDLLNDSEWRELFHSILNDRNSKEAMQSIMADENENAASRFTSKNFRRRIWGDKILNKWYRRVWIDKNIIGILQRPLRRTGNPFNAPFRRHLSCFGLPSACIAIEPFDPPTQLRQPGTYSFLSAVSLFLAYNEKFHSPPQTPWKVIPMEQILSHAYNQRMIYDRIVNKKGFSSYDYLHTLLAKSSRMENWERIGDLYPWRESLIDAIGDHGAGLISNFRVGSDFLWSDKLSYDGKPIFKYDVRVSHSMVLVGARLDRKGKCWLLVQNSWSSKQFVEMSLDYFCECEPEVHFARGKLELKGVFKPIEGPLIEYGFNDGGDSHIARRIDDCPSADWFRWMPIRKRWYEELSFDIEEVFGINDFKTPPRRFYDSLDDPIRELEEFIRKRLQEHNNPPEIIGDPGTETLKDSSQNSDFEDIDCEEPDGFSAASYEVKEYLLYVAAHCREDNTDVDLLNDSEWGELFHSILNDEKSQKVMRSLMCDGDKSRPSDTQKEKLLNKWRRQVYVDESIIGIIQRPIRRIVNRWRPSIACMAVDRGDPPMQLYQSEETYSFMSAVILFLAYNDKFHSPTGTPWKSIPMKAILSHAYSQRMIYDRIINKKGRSSYDYLRTFLVEQNFSKILTDWALIDYRWNPGVLIDLLKQHGAALISNFKAGRDFFEPDKFSYDGKPATRVYGAFVSHSMVLVGARLDRKGKCWLLVQNSWSSKQFVEMSLDYFCKCRPEVHFPRGKLELKGVFKPVLQRSIEYGFNDGGDHPIRTERTWKTVDPYEFGLC